MSELSVTERTRKIEHFSEKTKKRRYTKTKLLELRRNKKCQEWPRIFSKKFIGIDGKWDPVGAFESNTFTQRTHSRDGKDDLRQGDNIQDFYNERYRKRQRDDYKYYWYGESSKRYSSSYGSNYSHYYPSNTKQRYQYKDDLVYEPNRNRGSPEDYYQMYSYQSTKSRTPNDKESPESGLSDSKPEWFTGGPSNINETIELSGMSRELEAGILKNRKTNRRNDETFQQPKKSTSDSESNIHFSGLKTGEKNDISQMDSHLLKIIQKNAKENDKRKTSASAKEVEKVLKSILLRPNEESQETSTLSQNSNGVVLTVNEIEANLKLKGNRGAGDMSAYYKLLGLVQNNFNGNQSEENKTLCSPASKSLNHTVTSTNNNHPRQFVNSKYPIANTLKNGRNLPKINDECDLDPVVKLEESVFIENNDKESKEKTILTECNNELDKTSTISTNNPLKYEELPINSDVKKINGFNNFNIHNVNNTLRNERLAMASRNVCNPLSNQFSNHMLGTGQNAYRWIRAMNNAAAASARITQINQMEYCSTPENINNEKPENKADADPTFYNTDCNSLEGFNTNVDNNFRVNVDQSNVQNPLGSYINNFNLSNYMTPGSPLYNQLSLKQFLPFGYSQNSMFGRQFLNPYLLQQLFMHKQWENRNISLQNQLRQFQTMIFNCNSQLNVNNTVNNNPGYIPSSTMSLNQGDCSAISVSK